MTTYRVSQDRLEEVRVGGFIDINGERRRITRMSVEEAPEDVPELRIKAGDLVTTVELGPRESDGESETTSDA